MTPEEFEALSCGDKFTMDEGKYKGTYTSLGVVYKRNNQQPQRLVTICTSGKHEGESVELDTKACAPYAQPYVAT